MRTLLLLTALVGCCFLVKAQKPTIRMFPNYGVVYWGDTVVLKCSGTPTTWLVNDTTLPSERNQILILPAVSSKQSGDYQCETTEKSDKFRFNVHDYLPSAFLTLVSEKAVVNINEAAFLQLFSEEDVENWMCRILRNDIETYLLPNKTVSGTTFKFHVEIKGATPEIVWCKKKGSKGPSTVRSNSVTFRSSDKEVLLEVPPEPAVLGEPLTLTCEVRGGAKIEDARFYKDNSQIQTGVSDGSYKISSVTDRDKGSYQCQASFRYIFINPHGALKQNVPSEPQTLLIRDGPPSARITADDSDLTCSCPHCPHISSYQWYHQEPETKAFTWLEEKTEKVISYQTGKYICQAVWGKMTSRPGKFYAVISKSPGSPGTNPIIFVVLVLILAGLLLVTVAFLFRKKRREESDRQGGVPMTSMRRKKAAEEDVEKKDDYQPLKGSDKDEYHTLKAREGDGGDGGYEAVGVARRGDEGDGGYQALKAKEPSDVYHTLQQTDTQGAEGGYEALKGTKQSDTYHTLKPKAEDGGDGGYEAIKGERAGATGAKSDEKGLYQELGAGGGDGGYEELKMKKEADSKQD